MKATLAKQVDVEVIWIDGEPWEVVERALVTAYLREDIVDEGGRKSERMRPFQYTAVKVRRA